MPTRAFTIYLFLVQHPQKLMDLQGLLETETTVLKNFRYGFCSCGYACFLERDCLGFGPSVCVRWKEREANMFKQRLVPTMGPDTGKLDQDFLQQSSQLYQLEMKAHARRMERSRQNWLPTSWNINVQKQFIKPIVGQYQYGTSCIGYH
uniref:Uncharacterized protein n=1 Tax=Rhizophora mucronata TaxID=61149 RepID=A0A2P2N0R7_RHIMU